ncbi:MAG TPA: halocarboxylic acid dehydrogenase DehI family protein [Nitrospiraceae bacterium]|nr:halocarboxylic acid dehydrogenase DehI family protein [Nitrospiraceae bacterium]
MFGIGKPSPVAEYEADGEIEQIYHDIRQTLRVSGVNLNLRTWAGYPTFFSRLWTAIRPSAETRAFEDAGDLIRAEASRAAETLGKPDALMLVRLSDSQAYQIRAALALYHYINPKLLVLTSAVKLVLEGEEMGRGGAGDGRLERIARGVPARMYPMEMVEEEPEDEPTRDIFKDIKATLDLPNINSDYRTLALWPSYLSAAWSQLKTKIERNEYRDASTGLRDTARALARELPYPVTLDRRAIEAAGEDVEELMKITMSFERLLPPLIVNIALLQSDWLLPDELAASPFPAES